VNLTRFGFLPLTAAFSRFFSSPSPGAYMLRFSVTLPPSIHLAAAGPPAAVSRQLT
jgi:hypothetical protein